MGTPVPGVRASLRLPLHNLKVLNLALFFFIEVLDLAGRAPLACKGSSINFTGAGCHLTLPVYSSDGEPMFQLRPVPPPFPVSTILLGKDNYIFALVYTLRVPPLPPREGNGTTNVDYDKEILIVW